LIQQSRRKLCTARRVWSNPHNPPGSVAVEISRATGKPLTREQLGEALHAVKREAGLRPHDRVNIYDDGSITDDTDTWIGNVYDEI
jgi:hypothetical protein